MAQAIKLLPPIQNYLRQNCVLLTDVEAPDDAYSECYLITGQQANELISYNYGAITALKTCGAVGMEPATENRSQLIFWIAKDIHSFEMSVSPGFIRLPKLSHLITLTPEDFFALFRILATSTRATTNSLALNPHLAGVQDFSSSILFPFFELLKTNFRISKEYMDKKWTPNEAIALVAALEPTRDNQFSAMQYLTAIQNSDLLYFPVETVVELQLDWDQVSEDYCVPPAPELS